MIVFQEEIITLDIFVQLLMRQQHQQKQQQQQQHQQPNKTTSK